MSFQPITVLCQINSRINMGKINFFHLLLLEWQYPATPYFQVRTGLLICLEFREKMLPPRKILLAIGLAPILLDQCSGKMISSFPPRNCFSLHLLQVWKILLIFIE